jgi:hypothetical protein
MSKKMGVSWEGGWHLPFHHFQLIKKGTSLLNLKSNEPFLNLLLHKLSTETLYTPGA